MSKGTVPVFSDLGKNRTVSLCPAFEAGETLEADRAGGEVDPDDAWAGFGLDDEA